MSKKEKMSPVEFYADTMQKHLKLLILQFAQQKFMQDVGEKKKISEEERYEIVIDLLAKGTIVVVALGSHLWTIRPILDKKEWIPAPKFKELSGSYKEIKETLDKMKEMGYEQD